MDGWSTLSIGGWRQERKCFPTLAFCEHSLFIRFQHRNRTQGAHVQPKINKCGPFQHRNRTQGAHVQPKINKCGPRRKGKGFRSEPDTSHLPGIITLEPLWNSDFSSIKCHKSSVLLTARFIRKQAKEKAVTSSHDKMLVDCKGGKLWEK
jgi:hypothetical protein